MNVYTLLRKVLPIIDKAPTEITAADLRALSPENDLPSPWTTWALMVLIRYERRLRMGAKIIRRKLKRCENSSGIVPGLPEYKYWFHDHGCRLTNRVTGETIDVDFFRPDGSMINICFFMRDLPKLRQPPSVEARFLQLYPSITTVRLAMTDLRKSHLNQIPPWLVPNGYYLDKRTRKLAPGIEQFARAWEDPNRRLWLGALIADWMAAHEAATALGRKDLLEVTAQRADACRVRRLADLEHILETDDELADEALLALYELGPGEELTSRLKETLEGPITQKTVRAVEIIRKISDPVWCPQVEDFWQRIDPSGLSPQPKLWIDCVQYLLDSGYHRDKIIAALPDAGSDQVAVTALIALEQAPDQALGLLRRGLRSEVQASRAEAAAILALIDQPWSRRELLAVINESNDRDMTAECRVALQESRDRGARDALGIWESDHSTAETATCEITFSLREHFVRTEMAKLHDRVMPLRSRRLPETEE